MKKRYKVPKIYSKGIGYKIPLCSECGEEMVKFRGKWVCKICMKLKVKALPFWEEEEVEFGVLYPNRESRRKNDRY